MRPSSKIRRASLVSGSRLGMPFLALFTSRISAVLGVETSGLSIWLSLIHYPPYASRLLPHTPCLRTRFCFGSIVFLSTLGLCARLSPGRGVQAVA